MLVFPRFSSYLLTQYCPPLRLPRRNLFPEAKPNQIPRLCRRIVPSIVLDRIVEIHHRHLRIFHSPCPAHPRPFLPLIPSALRRTRYFPSPVSRPVPISLLHRALELTGHLSVPSTNHLDRRHLTRSPSEREAHVDRPLAHP